jgi:hypothetical protein
MKKGGNKISDGFFKAFEYLPTIGLGRNWLGFAKCAVLLREDRGVKCGIGIIEILDLVLLVSRHLLALLGLQLEGHATDLKFNLKVFVDLITFIYLEI